jgi:Glycosyltransferase family 87
VRFFPAFPMVARAIDVVTGMGVDPALVIVANLSALAAMAALVVLVRRDLGDAALARRSMALLALAPSAYVLVLGYADASLLLCSVVTMLGARTRRWWLAAAAGLGAGLLRPLGILLVVPVVVEVVNDWRMGSGRRGWVARSAAVVAPVVGTAGFLGWVGSQFGDAWLPFQVQQQSGHRGALTVPITSMGHNLASAFHGHHLGSALHVPWVILCVVLLVVAFRRLPLAYGAFAAAVLVASLTSSNLDSFERYALGAFPLVIAASTLTARRGVEVAVLVVSGVGMAGYAVLAFLGVVVP